MSFLYQKTETSGKNDYHLLSNCFIQGLEKSSANVAVIRAMDLRMMTLQNARERELRDWESIIQQADARFAISSVRLMEKSITGFLEVVFNG